MISVGVLIFQNHQTAKIKITAKCTMYMDSAMYSIIERTILLIASRDNVKKPFNAYKHFNVITFIVSCNCYKWYNFLSSINNEKQ